MKKFLFVMSHAAHTGIGTQETLDIILTTAAFDQPVALLFLDDGVYQLKNHQHPEKTGLKDTAAIYKALEIYQVNDVFVEVESMLNRGLKQGDLILPVRDVYRKNIDSLIQTFDVVFSS